MKQHSRGTYQGAPPSTLTCSSSSTDCPAHLTSSTHDTVASMPLLTDLPSEVRCKIWDYCIDKDLQVGAATGASLHAVYFKPDLPRALLALNKQTRREVQSRTTWRVGVNIRAYIPGEADTRTAEEFDTAATLHTDAIWHCKRIKLCVRVHRSYAEDCSIMQICNLAAFETAHLYILSLAEINVKRKFKLKFVDDEARR